MSLEYQKEIHTSELLSYRITYFNEKLFFMGGWFVGECPGMRGDSGSPLLFDPALSQHSSVMRGQYWLRLQQRTGAILVSSHMCALRPNDYPPKPEDFMLSPNLRDSLGVKLSSLACPHPTGTHTAKFGTDISISKTWLPELCRILVAGISTVTPSGGSSLRLGVDDAASFAMDTLHTSDLTHWIRLEHASMRLGHASTAFPTVPRHIVAAAAIRREDLLITSCSPTEAWASGYGLDLLSDTDPRLEDAVFYISAAQGCCMLDPVAWEFYGEGDACFVVLSTPVETTVIPQTEVALRSCRDRDTWYAADQNEIDTLCAIPVWEEVWGDHTDFPRAWRTKFVRALKSCPLTSDSIPRSRLVMVAPGHQQGIEYSRADAPTPMWGSTVMLMGAGTVKGAFPFQFDLKQFFQHTDVDTPAGDLIMIPPPRYQQKRDDGTRLYWKAVKWLQGAKGAGRASHLKLVMLLIDPANGFRFARDLHDPCVLHHFSGEGEIHFSVHVDDGIGWATTVELRSAMHALLAKEWPDIKWYNQWIDIMGFATAHDINQRTLGFTAPKHIDALRALVANDCSYTPKSPWSQEMMQLEPCPQPAEVDSIAWHLWINRASYCKQVLGSLRHISKIRGDIMGPLNKLCQYAHAPDERLPKLIKHVALYTIGTANYGPVFGGPGMSFDDFSPAASLPDDYELDVEGTKLPYYHLVIDGALSVDRSTSGIIHMFAGAAFNTGAFRQHSIAKDAHDSEVFTASSAAAQSIPARGILRGVNINMSTRTAIFSDSRSTRLISISASALKNSIYLARRVMFMREGIDDGEYFFYTVAGKWNPADGLTKYVSIEDFKRARDYMGIIEVKSIAATVVAIKIKK